MTTAGATHIFQFRSALRRVLFGNLWRVLAGLLGIVQVAIGHWVIVVLAGREGSGWTVGLFLTALLVAANLLTVPILRRARLRGGWARRVARAYMGGALATLLLGIAVGFSWLGLFPVATALSSLGIGEDLAFGLFRVASAATVCGLAAMLVWGFTAGQARVEHTRIRIPVAGLEDAHRGLRIAHLSDLHIGNGFEGARLRALVNDANAIPADMLVLTGDIFDFDPSFVEDGARELAGLEARLGVYAVLGNHDTYTGREEVARAFATHAPSIRLLRDETVRLPVEPALYLSGIEDPGRDWTARDVHLESLERLGRSMPEDGVTILLVHRPEVFPQAARLGYPLVLAGHTHGGQLALPTPGGTFNLARLITRYTRGLYHEHDSALYVNRGVGVAGPAIRFNCAREIAAIELS